MKVLTAQEVDEYEALLNAASPGPWRLWQKRSPAEVVDPDDISIGRIWTELDAVFIEASRTMGPALVEEVRRLRCLVRDFVDPDPCSFDHHGYCKVHGHLSGEPGSCPHGRARKLLEAIDVLENKEHTTCEH